MICPICGTNLPDGAPFCDVCGNMIMQEPQAPERQLETG